MNRASDAPLVTGPPVAGIPYRYLALATVSFMRFNVRRKVDLPQPDGPMKAVTRLVPSVRSDTFAAT